MSAPFAPIKPKRTMLHKVRNAIQSSFEFDDNSVWTDFVVKHGEANIVNALAKENVDFTQLCHCIVDNEVDYPNISLSEDDTPIAFIKDHFMPIRPEDLVSSAEQHPNVLYFILTYWADALTYIEGVRDTAPTIEEREYLHTQVADCLSEWLGNSEGVDEPSGNLKEFMDKYFEDEDSSNGEEEEDS